VTEAGITLTFASGARVDLFDEEAAWLRDERWPTRDQDFRITA
jgi:hypothetical protein